jgi:hypothetical protein
LNLLRLIPASKALYLTGYARKKGDLEVARLESVDSTDEASSASY